MKKILCMTLAAITLMASECNPDPIPIPSIFDAGDGSATNPYVITTATQLDLVREDMTAHYKLGGNIDLTGYLKSTGAGFSKWSTAGWLPIGDGYGFFTGGFDGAGYKITGLTINRPSSQFVGLFNSISSSSAYIKNLGVEGVNITGDIYVGGVVGYIDNVSITNCYVTGTVKGNRSVGGVVGQDNNGIITNCYAISTVNGNVGVGGLVGRENGGSITKSYTTGAVTGNECVGGVAGELNNSGSITNCYALGAVNGSDGYVGGVVGYFYSGSMTNCYATGEVSGANFVGGIAGYGLGIITNCVALSKFINRTSPYSGTYFGRVVGVNEGTLTNNWAYSGITASGGITYSTGGINGANCAEIPTRIWWISFPGTGPNWSSSDWTFVDGQYPKLK